MGFASLSRKNFKPHGTVSAADNFGGAVSIRFEHNRPTLSHIQVFHQVASIRVLCSLLFGEAMPTKCLSSAEYSFWWPYPLKRRTIKVLRIDKTLIHLALQSNSLVSCWAGKGKNSCKPRDWSPAGFAVGNFRGSYIIPVLYCWNLARACGRRVWLVHVLVRCMCCCFSFSFLFKLSLAFLIQFSIVRAYGYCLLRTTVTPAIVETRIWWFVHQTETSLRLLRLDIQPAIAPL